jgi:hypothetical protein
LCLIQPYKQIQEDTVINATRLRAINFSLCMCWSTYLTLDLAKFDQLKKKRDEVVLLNDTASLENIDMLIAAFDKELVNSKLFDSPIAYDA